MITAEQAMKRAHAISLEARLRAPPNPWVGCVLVKDGVIIGEGATQPPGQDHAEVQALKQAGAQAQGATMYVTLEPCAHYGRTPPCTMALIRSGIVKVVVALQDPDPKVSGKGLQQLQAAGIATEVGFCADLVQETLLPYLHHRLTTMPYCIAKAAISIDGRIAAQDGSSRWITGEAARADAHVLRAQSQAILIGAGTAINDRPLLTVRHVQAGLNPPLRVLLDSTGRVPLDTPLFDTSAAPTLVVTTERAAPNRWKGTGVEVVVLPESPGGIDMKACLQLLGQRGVLQLLVEGGPTVLTHLWSQGLIQQLVLYVGPRILGDNGKPLFTCLSIPSIDQAPVLQLQSSQQFDDCMRLDYSTQSSKLFK